MPVEWPQNHPGFIFFLLDMTFCPDKSVTELQQKGASLGKSDKNSMLTRADWQILLYPQSDKGEAAST
ncbi:MAG: hypothetical protein ACI9TB_000263 [Parasphingorhabdus sp.]|jgi:hypothetical protein